ncbi:FabD/lysophospholipase-like protein [Patellaria atrata CBS 101060]|uniref:FabD/lysophospholipase-like protein n=1 Tax=Patellaria atrata CBS 101060 TaxID=1346257 RepID=A0A9P4VL23_9PEZI|nr:FabD/lysophospholipase-like protein [Patellaria atrata CBS 101060]
MAQNATSVANHPVNLLALDGGGIRGISELLILDEIMNRVKCDLKLKQDPRPCDYFDLIGGTSTGGLIALMLGRLRMTTNEALKNYNSLASKKRMSQDGAFKATVLENEIKKLVSSRGLGDCMLDTSIGPSSKGRAFVCAMPAGNLAHPRLFRTYSVRELRSPNCEIWQACRATSAAPTFFKRISIGDEGHTMEDFIDGALGCNNPVNELLEEARKVFGSDRKVGCLISIGTGHPGPIGLATPDSAQRLIPTDLIGVLKKIVTDCERVAERLEQRFQDCPGFYFRFSIIHGAAGISLEEWERMGELKQHTIAYMTETRVHKALNEVVERLCKPVSFGITLRDMCAIPDARVRVVQKVQIRAKPKPSPIFTGRKTVLGTMDNFFVPRTGGSFPRREFLLYGLGGAGKTQTALQFAQVYGERFERVFWIDASSTATTEQSYKEIGIENGLGDTIEGVLRWLSNLKQEWLLLLDNCESNKDLERLSPRGENGNIIYTSRNPSIGHLLPPEAVLRIDEMESSDSVTLLLRAARLNESGVNSRRLATRIVEELGFLPLAIDLAGASIHMGESSLEDYIHTFHNHRKEMLKNPRYKGVSEANQAVYATWDISYAAIERVSNEEGAQKSNYAAVALQILRLFAFLHNDGIMEDIFRRAAEPGKLKIKFFSTAEIDNGGFNLPGGLLKIDSNDNWDPFLFRKGISTLLSYSLIRKDESQKFFSMHVLVHEWARDLIPQTNQLDCLRATRELLASSINWEMTTVDNAYRRQLLPHILACEQHGGGKQFLLEDVKQCEMFAWVFQDVGKWKDAQELNIPVAEAKRRMHGKEHPDTLRIMHNVAITFLNQGLWKDAEALLIQIVDTRRRLFGKQNQDTLLSMSHLASTISAQGGERLKEAEALEIQVLEAQRMLLGKEHPNTLESMSTLASTISEQGQERLKEAEELQIQVIEMRKRVLGEEHTSTLTSMSNLACTLKSQNRNKEAILLMANCAQLREKRLGPLHPRTKWSLEVLHRWKMEEGKSSERGSR